VATLMSLFPPFRSGPRFVGYRPVFAARTYRPSAAELREEQLRTGFDFAGLEAQRSIDWRLLLTQGAVLLVLSGAVFLVVGARPNGKQLDQTSDRKTGVARWHQAARLSLYAAGVVLFVNFLVPPWVYTFQSQGISQVTVPAGYAVLFMPPQPRAASLLHGVAVDSRRLVLQTLAIVVLTRPCLRPSSMS
jgi:hypothetical protein